MEEVTLSGEVHRDTSFNRRRNYFFITDRTAGLNNRANTRVEQQLEPVSKGEERVARRNRPLGPVTRPRNRELA